jgi:hypothetical protein
MTRVEPILDYIVLAVPDHVAHDDPSLPERLTDEAQRNILAQYRRPPRALIIEPIDWLITSNPSDVERHQPAHDCPTCRAGNDQAQAFLAEHPDRYLALGNLRYTEVWT